MTENQSRDSNLTSCLFKHLAKSNYHLQDIQMIKPNVFLLQTNNKKIISKKIRNKHAFDMQNRLLTELHNHQFTQTYQFIEDLTPMNEKGQVFAFLSYIEPSLNQFSFNSIAACHLGLALLDQFHQATAKFEKSFEQLEYCHLIERWQLRLQEFLYHLHIQSSDYEKKFFYPYVQFGEKALQGMKEFDGVDKGHSVIIHGDVAHHNFLRNQAGELHLIDFDLIARGHAMFDILQYANRILPVCQFSLMKLKDFPIINHFFQHPYFLYALSFPSDIFREFNRMHRLRVSVGHRELFLQSISHQHHLRIDFFHKIQSMLK